MDFKDKVEMLLTFPDLYLEGMVSRIDEDHMIRPVESMAEAFDNKLKTIKIEELEKVFEWVYLETLNVKREANHNGPCNAHLFWAPANGPSFVRHEDPYDIYLKWMWGTKTIEIDGEVITLNADNPGVWVPAGTPHRGVNIEESIMISFGNERFLEDRWKL